MSVEGPRGRRIASLRRRFLAGVINGAIFLVTLGVGIAVAVKLAPTARRMYGRVRPLIGGEHGRREPGATNELRLSAPLTIAMWIASLGVSVRGRNSRGLGERLVRIRRVDARSGGPVSVRSALIGACTTSAWGWISQQPFRPMQKHAVGQTAALEPRIREIQREHQHDLEAQHRAIMELFKASKVNPFSSCARHLPGLLVRYLPTLLSAGNRTFLDRISGTVVIVERHSGSSPCLCRADAGSRNWQNDRR